MATTDSFVAWEGSRTDGPFLDPLGYMRNNVTGNIPAIFRIRDRLGFKFSGGANGIYSSGQIPLDEVAAGRLNRFGAIDPINGGMFPPELPVSITVRIMARRIQSGRFLQPFAVGFILEFHFLLNDPENGDAIQQHDSRIQEGANVQYYGHHVGGHPGTVTTERTITITRSTWALFEITGSPSV